MKENLLIKPGSSAADGRIKSALFDQELIHNNNFIRDCINPQLPQLAQDYLLRQSIVEKTASAISQEISELQQQVLQFNDSLATPTEYLNLLYGLSLSLFVINEEAELLELLIPYWEAKRGVKLGRDKPIDEFYAEFELLTLWRLIAKSIQSQEFLAEDLLKMRSIIRRYSNMPSFWLYLWDISGEEVKVGFTF